MVYRADHNLQDLRAKLFPTEIEKANKENEVVPLTRLPVKRKERSLSSLVVTAPRASVQSSMTRRRKYPAKKNPIPRESALLFEEPVKKEEDFFEDFSSPQTKNKIAANGGQVEEVKLQLYSALNSSNITKAMTNL